MDLKSRSDTNGSVRVLELKGRFDAYEAPPVKEWLNEAATSANPTQVVVNLAQVDFIDSTGLATLVQGMKHCRQQRGDLHLCALQQPIRIIFELTRLDKAFQIFTEEDEAVKAFANENGLQVKG
jgi:anti-sigma B factor antagonist